MRFLWSGCLALVLACGALNTVAGVVAVYDIKLQSDKATPYLQLELTEDIYRYSRSSDLQDLVVVDGQGNRLPHRVIRIPVAQAPQEQVSHVHFFPVPVGAKPETLLALSSASIRLDDNAISVTVEKTPRTELLDQQAPIDFYVVDLTEFRATADKLQLDWQVAEINQYLDVEISGSNDLSSWSPVAHGTLVQLQKNGQKLTRKQIGLNLHAREYAYLRLQFPRGGQGLLLTSVQVITQQASNALIADRQWQVTGRFAEDQTSALNAKSSVNKASAAAWEFTRAEMAPVTRISLALGETSYGDNIKLFSRRTEKQPWQLVYQGVWFNAQVGDVWQHSDSISIYQNSDLFWRVELSAQVRNNANPILVFHHQSQLLQFIASNAAPFKVGIETDHPLPNHSAGAQVFSQLTAGKEVQWEKVDAVNLDPDIHQFARFSESVNWTTLVFWGILLLAVGVLVFVAIRLIKAVGSTSQ